MRTSRTIFILFLNSFLHLHVKNCPRPTDSEKTISSVIVRQGEIYSEDSRQSPENPKITKLTRLRQAPIPTAVPERSPHTLSEVSSRGRTKSGLERAPEIEPVNELTKCSPLDPVSDSLHSPRPQ